MSSAGHPRVFVSYARSDGAIADKLVAALEKRGLLCWVAHRDVAAGSEWAEAINDAIKHSRVVVLVYSRHTNQSQQVLREMERAVHGDKRIIPFMVDQAPLSKSMEYYLGATQWLDVTGIEDSVAVSLAEKAIRKMDRDDGWESRPVGVFDVPIPPKIRGAYWLTIASGFISPFVVPPMTGEVGEGALAQASFVFVPAVAFGTFGLLWARKNWSAALVTAILSEVALVLFYVLIWPNV